MRGDTVTRSDAHLVHLVSLLAAAGLAALWLSGIGFMTLAWFNNPALFTSPKVQAKVLVVCVLTINGAILHFKVLPQVARAVGRPLFCKKESTRTDRIMMRACGAISAASWWTPFFLGTVRELNFAAPIQVFLGAYLALLAVFGAGFTVVEHYVSTRFGPRAHDPADTPSPAPLLSAAALMAASTIDDRVSSNREDAASAIREEKSFGVDGGLAGLDPDSPAGEPRRRPDHARRTGDDADLFPA